MAQKMKPKIIQRETPKEPESGFRKTFRVIGNILKYGIWKPIQYVVLKPIGFALKKGNRGVLVLLAMAGIGGYAALRPSSNPVRHRAPEKRESLAVRMVKESQETFKKTGSYNPIVNEDTKMAEEPVWDHPDKTPAEFYREKRLTTSQLLEDTGGDQFFEPEPLQISPVMMIRKELSEAVSNGANYDKTADAVIYIQDTVNPDNVIVFGLGVLPSQANQGCTSLIMTTMPSKLSGESRPMAGTRFNVALGDYRFNLRVEAGDIAQGEETEQVVIGYPDDKYPTVRIAEQHGGSAVALTDAGNRVSAASEGKAEEIATSHSQRFLNKAPDLVRTWETGGREPQTARVTAAGMKTAQAIRLNRLRNGR